MISKRDLLNRLKRLKEEPDARVPICLVLDISGSMIGEPIEKLNEGISAFYSAIKEDDDARGAADIAIVTFGGEAKAVTDFDSIDKQIVPSLIAYGGTPMGEAINIAIDMLEERKNQYKRVGVDYFQPWLILMTDGQPNGNEAQLEEAIRRTNSLLDARKLTVFPIAIGQHADEKVLERFSGKSPLYLENLKFREFFTWLGRSVQVTTESIPGEEIKLDINGINKWAKINL